MKRILFAYRKMDIGGVPRVLLSQFRDLRELGYNVDLFLISQTGDFLDQIPENVRLVNFGLDLDHINKILFDNYSVRGSARRLNIFRSLKLLAKKKKGELIVSDKRLFNSIDIGADYDIAVCATVKNDFVLDLVANYVNAEKKFLWVHTPNYFYENGELIGTENSEKWNSHCRKHLIEKYDKIICVSKGIEDSLSAQLPELSDKMTTIYNPMNIGEILSKGNKYDPQFDKNILNIVSVGRLAYQKGFDMALKAAEILKNSGLNYKWYIVGGGRLQKKLVKQAEKRGLKDKFILVGPKVNPYPYIKHCDLYCQPSRFEAYCTTVNEARMFHRPIVATDFTGIREQIEDGISGIITSFDAGSFADAIMRASDKELRDSFEKNSLFPNRAEANASNDFLELFK